MDLTNPATLSGVLSQLSCNDTATLKSAERLLKQFLRDPGCAAVMARSTQGEEWPELFDTLLQLSAHESPPLRALTYSLMAQLTEQVTALMTPHVHTLAQMLTQGCADSSDAVREAALGAIAALIRELGNAPEVMVLAPLVGQMLGAMSASLGGGGVGGGGGEDGQGGGGVGGVEEVVVVGLEVIQEACLLTQPLVNPHLPQIVHFTLSVLAADLETGVKTSAGQTLLAVTQNRPNLLAKCGLITPILLALLQSIAQEGQGQGMGQGGQGGQGEEEDDSPEKEQQLLAQSIADSMALHIPPRHFAPPAMALVAQGLSSDSTQMRKAGCYLLGVIAEGCVEVLRTSLGDILPRLLQLLSDPHPPVRESACFALGEFSNFCQPDILHHHRAILGALFGAPPPGTLAPACSCLERFCAEVHPRARHNRHCRHSRRCRTRLPPLRRHSGVSAAANAIRNRHAISHPGCGDEGRRSQRAEFYFYQQLRSLGERAGSLLALPGPLFARGCYRIGGGAGRGGGRGGGGGGGGGGGVYSPCGGGIRKFKNRRPRGVGVFSSLGWVLSLFGGNTGGFIDRGDGRGVQSARGGARRGAGRAAQSGGARAGHGGGPGTLQMAGADIGGRGGG
ncbi:armadillo-type protein, partial [Ochromonadaceae sp. CCMP2298]